MQESTYGTHIHEPREERESRFTNLIHDIIGRGGRCLIPVFALGRAQELLLILGMFFTCLTNQLSGNVNLSNFLAMLIMLVEYLSGNLYF